MIRLDELLEVKSLKNLFKKLSYKMKDEKGWPQQTLVQFWWTTENKNVNIHVTVCFTTVKNECFCLLLGVFFIFWLESNSYAFLM